jgi:dTDP-D-glucose 4,6-dehydratase
MVVITGGTGFIGSNLVHYWIEKMTGAVINVDKLTYAGILQSLVRIFSNPRHIFVRADIGDSQLISNLLAKYKPPKAIDLAAESHLGLRQTIRWYLGNRERVTNVASGAYRDWVALHYDEHADSA